MTIQIIIADDHPIVRSGIKNELLKQDDFQVVYEVMNTDDAFSKTIDLEPDVLTLDINMPGNLRASDVVRKLKASECSTKVLIVSAHKDSEVVIGSIQAGADGYLLKEEDVDHLAEAVRSLAKGDDWISPKVTTVITRQIKKTPERESITSRESEVLRLVVDGLKNEEIAKKLGVTKRTIEFHMTNIMGKLALDSRGKVVAWAKDTNYFLDF